MLVQILVDGLAKQVLWIVYIGTALDDELVQQVLWIFYISPTLVDELAQQVPNWPNVSYDLGGNCLTLIDWPNVVLGVVRLILIKVIGVSYAYYDLWGSCSTLINWFNVF